MLLEPNARNNLMTLLRLAREEADDLRADLADVELAMTAADASLTALASAGADASGEVDERDRVRSLRLFATRETLSTARDDIRAKLEAATAELAKLERLIAIGADVGRCDVRLTGAAPRAGAFEAARRLVS